MVSLEHYKVPTEPFRLLVAKYLHDTQMEMTAFSEACGLDESTLYKTLRRPEIRFDLADKIICETYGPLLWQRPPFLELYWQGEVPPDRIKPVKCINPKCDVWMSVHIIPTSGVVTGGTYIRDKKCCSPNCKAAVQRRKNPKSHKEAVKRHRDKNREWYRQYMRDWRARKKAAS